MKILSVIIPSYNSEAFLDECMASFVNAEVLEKLDIIIVNDGSSDNTPSIANKYADMHPSSVRVIHQENKGHGGAINAGCLDAVGKYLKVIDADDTVNTENLNVFINELEGLDCDVVLTHYNTVDITNGEIKKWMCYPSEFGKKYTIDEVVSNWNDYSRCMTLHGITYRTDFYKSIGYNLSEKVFYEDHELSTFPACFAKSIVPLDIFLYNYRIGDMSQSVSDKNRLARMKDMQFVLQRFAEEYRALPEDEHIREFVSQKAKILLVSYLTTALLVDNNKKTGKKNASEMMRFIKDNLPRAYELSLKQYKVFRLLNIVGIKKRTLDRFLTSKFYLKVKGTHNFN